MLKKIALTTATITLLSIALTSCAPANNTPAPTATAPQITNQPVTPPVLTTPTPTTPALTAAAAQNGSAAVIVDFYNGTFKISHKTALAAQKLNDQHDSLSAAAYSKKMEALIPTLKDIYAKNTTTERVAAFEYGYTLVIVSAADALQASGKQNELKFFIDKTSIVPGADNTTATTPASAVGVDYNEQKKSNTSSTGNIHTIYAGGKWYIDASKD